MLRYLLSASIISLENNREKKKKKQAQFFVFLFHGNKVAIIFLCAVRDGTLLFSEGNQDYQNQHCRQKQPALPWVRRGNADVTRHSWLSSAQASWHPCQKVLFLDESKEDLLPPTPIHTHFWLQKIYWLPQLVHFPTEIALKCDKSNISFTKTRLEIVPCSVLKSIPST